MLIQCHGLKDQLGIYIFHAHQTTKGRMICASADIFVVASPSFLGAPIFPFLVGYWSAPFLLNFLKHKIKKKKKSYLLVGHYMVLVIHTQQKQQQLLDCLDWLPYLPTLDINLSSMYLLSPIILIFFFFFFRRGCWPTGTEA